MKIWIVSACLALALAATAVSSPASAHDNDWNGSWNGDWNNGGGNGWGGNGSPPWLGYNNPAWPHQPQGCLNGGRWDDDCDNWHDGKHKKYVPQGIVIRQVYAAGYRHIFDIDRDGNRYTVTALDRRGRHVLLTFNARNGDFIKKKYL